eukprot:TRINITY_DN2871_c1_g1_i1.p1 TRINITY_DN2871_c1_g1~~TRINITY_DN2871_c1_g1_i1.p1  ORF type:complete len:115 (-),score=19.08 TRINITY_DN2871_c1_g1_i1:903-1247(-)
MPQGQRNKWVSQQVCMAIDELCMRKYWGIIQGGKVHVLSTLQKRKEEKKEIYWCMEYLHKQTHNSFAALLPSFPNFMFFLIQATTSKQKTVFPTRKENGREKKKKKKKNEEIIN